jgi:alcohol dehydrogenase class IV
MIRPFTFTFDPARVVFGRGTLANLPAEIDALGCSRVLVLATREQAPLADSIANRLGTKAAVVFAGAQMHTPVDVTERAVEVCKEARVDGVVAVGGGSTIGLGKAIVLRTGVKSLAIPTTYAGSEMTPILGETVNGRKTTQRTPAVLSRSVLYDVDLTLSLPKALSATSGLNAIAHAAEALYAHDTNPVVELMAEEAVRALASSLPRIMQAGDDIEARTEALYGAWLCGICLGRVAMSLHHKLCHVLGGMFDLPHALTHAVLLPHTIAYNASAAPQAMARLSRALGTHDAIAGLAALNERLDVPRSLAEIGMPRDGIDAAADQAVQNPYANPRPIDRKSIKTLLERAFAGAPPAA